MPKFERLTAEQLALRLLPDYDLVTSLHETNRFGVLPPRHQQVLELYYMSDTLRSDEEVGKLLEPPRSASRVKEIRQEAVRWLVSPYVKEYQIDPLRLSPRTRNGLRRFYDSYDISPEELLAVPDEELLGIRNFGRKSLEELHDRLSAYFQPESSKGS